MKILKIFFYTIFVCTLVRQMECPEGVSSFDPISSGGEPSSVIPEGLRRSEQPTNSGLRARAFSSLSTALSSEKPSNDLSSVDLQEQFMPKSPQKLTRSTTALKRSILLGPNPLKKTLNGPGSVKWDAYTTPISLEQLEKGKRSDQKFVSKSPRKMRKSKSLYQKPVKSQNLLSDWGGSWGYLDQNFFDAEAEDITGEVEKELNESWTAKALLTADPNDLRLKEGVQLTEQSLAQIKKINELLQSWTFAPFKRAFNFVFPIDDCAVLIKDLASSEAIPVDVGARIEAIVQKIPLLPSSVRSIVTGVGLDLTTSRRQALEYVLTTIPALESFAKVVPDYEKLKKIVDEHQGDPVEALRAIHQADIKTLQQLPIKEVITKLDSVNQTKEQTIQKTEKINKIVTQVCIMMFALAITSLILSIVQEYTQDPKVQKAMEDLIIIDIASIIGGIGYGAIKFGQSLTGSLTQPNSTESATINPASTAAPSSEPIEMMPV